VRQTLNGNKNRRKKRKEVGWKGGKVNKIKKREKKEEQFGEGTRRPKQTKSLAYAPIQDERKNERQWVRNVSISK